MVLFSKPLGVFAWTIDEDVSDFKFTKKFQTYLSEFLLSVNDVKTLRTLVNMNYKTKTEVLFIISNYAKLKNPVAFGEVTDKLYESWKNETLKQLDIYESKFKTFT